VPLPVPVPGLVIRYSYLWDSEHLAGREEGQKDRPCAIVAALRPADDAGETRVLVLPVTHTPPSQATVAVEIPARVTPWSLRSATDRRIVPSSRGPNLERSPIHLIGGPVSGIPNGIDAALLVRVEIAERV
jgi:hypothetical protein